MGHLIDRGCDLIHLLSNDREGAVEAAKGLLEGLDHAAVFPFELGQIRLHVKITRNDGVRQRANFIHNATEVTAHLLYDMVEKHLLARHLREGHIEITFAKLLDHTHRQFLGVDMGLHHGVDQIGRLVHLRKLKQISRDLDLNIALVVFYGHMGDLSQQRLELAHDKVLFSPQALLFAAVLQLHKERLGFTGRADYWDRRERKHNLFHFNLGEHRLCQPRQHLALMAWLGVEFVNAGANNRIGPKVRHLLTYDRL